MPYSAGLSLITETHTFYITSPSGNSGKWFSHGNLLNHSYDNNKVVGMKIPYNAQPIAISIANARSPNIGYQSLTIEVFCSNNDNDTTSIESNSYRCGKVTFSNLQEQDTQYKFCDNIDTIQGGRCWGVRMTSFSGSDTNSIVKVYLSQV